MRARRTLILSILLATLVSLSGISAPAQAGVRVSIGVPVPFPPQPLRHEVIAVRPGPDYVWVGGYWNWSAGDRQYVWTPGAWTRPPHAHAVWVKPRFENRAIRRGHHRSYRHYYRPGYWR